MLNGNTELSLMSFPGYREAWDKLMKLRGQASDLDRKAEELRVRGKPESLKTQREKQLDAVIAGEEPGAVKSTEKWLTDLEEARNRARLFEEAAKKQEKEVQTERLIASKEVCKKVGPQYEDIVKRLALAYIELGKVVIEEKEFRENLNDADVAYGGYIRPMVIHGPGDPRDHTSRISAWLIEAIVYDFISLNDIPSEWRKTLKSYIEAKKRMAGKME